MYAAAAVLAVSLALASSVLGKNLVQVPLQGTDGWIPAARLSLPGMNIQAFNAPPSQYDAKAWNDHITSLCNDNQDCTSTAVWKTAKFDGKNWGAVQWFGGIYRGGHTKTDDYRKSTDTAHPVTDAQFWTVP